MISAMNSTSGAEAEPLADVFQTEAQKLALCEKCLQSLSPRALPIAASMYETNAEVKAGMLKQRQRTSEKKKSDTQTQHEICHKMHGVTLAIF